MRRITVSARRNLSGPWYLPNDWGPNPKRAKIAFVSLLAFGAIAATAFLWLMIAST
jgi:hypothetical protein